MSRKIFVARSTPAEIERIARKIRQKLGIDEGHSPNLLDILESLESKIGFKVKYVEAHPHSKRVQAWADGKKKILYILHKTKEALKYGADQARELVAHEIGHLALNHPSLKYEVSGEPLAVHRQEEAEANIFMRRFLVPSHLAEKCESSEEIRRLFRVTGRTAQERYEEVIAERSRPSTKEAIPPSATKPEVAQRHVDYSKYAAPQRSFAYTKAKLLTDFDLFRGNGGGIESWFSDSITEPVVDVLVNCERRNISHEVLNQLLILSHEAGMSKGFFRFYFLTDPHPKFSWYDPKKLPDFDNRYLNSQNILNLSHLRWGLYRLYVDALLYFGNIRQAYRSLRTKSKSEIEAFFLERLFDSGGLVDRGSSLPLEPIAHNDRYLIAEKACKTYQPSGSHMPDLIKFMKEKYREHRAKGRNSITIEELVASVSAKDKYSSDQLSFSLNEVLKEKIESENSIESAVHPVLTRFQSARARALKNTELYLSMIQDLDIYVATSMRKPIEFTEMAKFCDRVFQDPKLRELKLRHFDPTLSAAESHEDKGLIECLMVNCAKMLVYNAGEDDSFGKAAEAAMALNRGKPVIFYCNVEKMRAIYKDFHPLSRLIDFENGVAVGGIVTPEASHVVELISRIFRNDMEFVLNKKKSNYFLLTEKLTGSTVRLQTDNQLLRETFWNYYQSGH